ncbi:MCP four helix bundle domain-containing protein [Adhaeribacter sp. BT258]|uniref:MCP four helix bundle domain-containing protein n=1 Tax=Adhaeribacter terrigena TaxID=2793070 RepID=A0ABS1C5R9_9BACT|nr:MCP four helix bundle domain-containing protein [Adhaeribacter terrigena]MBK0404715.1 MCP four helix bundle domain-containing protein [Adhaeribacter terrigena]
MKWAFTIQQKTRAALILGVVFLLVFAKNCYDERKVAELGNSFASVYEDRLVVESYIYQLSDHLYQKKIMLDNCSSQENLGNLQAKIGAQNSAIHSLILHYEKTRLTEKEAVSFQDFKENVATIEKLESQYMAGVGQALPEKKVTLDASYVSAAENLHELSGIQVAEGRLLSEKSKKMIAGSSLLTQFELAILIGVGLLIQGLIFAAKSAKPKKPQQHFSLN